MMVHTPAIAGMAQQNMTHAPTGDMQDMMMMPMYFVFGHKTTILFKDWETSTMAQYIGSCIAVVIMAVIYEWGKILRADLDAWIIKRITPSPCCINLVNSHTKEPTVLENGGTGHNPSHRSHSLPPSSVPVHYQLLRTVCHMVHFTLSYLLMLIAMTYSVGLFVSMILGSGIGYFLFMRRNICQAKESMETVSACH